MARRQNRGKTKKANTKKIIISIIAIILVIVIILICVNNKEEEKYDEIRLIIGSENVTSNLKEKIVEKDEKIYLSYEDIEKFIDPTIEKEGNLIITTSDKKLASIGIDDENITINGSTQKIGAKAFEENEKIYLPISELENVYDIDLEYIKETKTVTIDQMSKELKKAYTSKKVELKEEKKATSKTLEKIEKGSWVIYIQEENNWVKVRTSKGNIGYIKKNKLTNITTERENLEDEESTENVEYIEKNISKEDLSTFEKRLKIINDSIQEAVQSDKMAIKIVYEAEKNEYYEKFKIEIRPMLKECGIKLQID